MRRKYVDEAGLVHWKTRGRGLQRWAACELLIAKIPSYCLSILPKNTDKPITCMGCVIQ